MNSTIGSNCGMKTPCGFQESIISRDKVLPPIGLWSQIKNIQTRNKIMYNENKSVRRRNLSGVDRIQETLTFFLSYLGACMS
jgi:hypothetical protein